MSLPPYILLVQPWCCVFISLYPSSDCFSLPVFSLLHLGYLSLAGWRLLCVCLSICLSACQPPYRILLAVVSHPSLPQELFYLCRLSGTIVPQTRLSLSLSSSIYIRLGKIILPCPGLVDFLVSMETKDTAATTNSSLF